MKVSIRGDREDRDLLEQGNGSINSSTTLALDSRLVLIIHFQFATRNLHGSMNWLFLDPFWASGIASVRRGDLPLQQTDFPFSSMVNLLRSEFHGDTRTWSTACLSFLVLGISGDFGIYTMVPTPSSSSSIVMAYISSSVISVGVFITSSDAAIMSIQKSSTH